jgi:Uma2 family endonuclease
MAVTGQPTLDEFLRLPEEKPALEYARGVITQKMAPLGWHGLLQGDLYFRFRNLGFPQRRVTAMTETRVTWTAEGISYVPDVIAYRAERVPKNAQGEVTDQVMIPPDVAVEIWSPGQTLGDQMERCRWYVAHEVPVALLVHPHRRTVGTFRPDAEDGPLRDSDMVDLNDVFASLSFTVSELFEALRG